jgi:glycosyltransferase involved in cell wall biosynthesis
LITRLFDRHGFGSKRATKRLIKDLDNIKLDAIGLHNLHGYYLNIRVLFHYLDKKKIPVIWTFHDCWPFTGHCTYFDSVNCEKWKTQCQKCPKTKMYPASLGWDNSIKNYQDKKAIFNSIENLQIVTPSHWLKNLVSQSFLKHSATCIHNGIDINQFKPISKIHGLKYKWQLKHKKVVLGVASTWDDRKGPSDFITLSETLPTEYQIILIGLSKTQIEALPKTIIGIERTESISELALYYSVADVFVNPTYQDNFPTTNIEALACGTPVFTYPTGGSPEAIDTETGVVVGKGDIKALQEAIITWCETKNSTTVQIKCKERAVAHFNKDDRYQEYLKLYEKSSVQN